MWDLTATGLRALLHLGPGQGWDLDLRLDVSRRKQRPCPRLGLWGRGAAQWTCVEGRVQTLTAPVTSP